MKKLSIILLLLLAAFISNAQYCKTYNPEPDRLKNLGIGMIIGGGTQVLAYDVLDIDFTTAWLISGAVGVMYSTGAELYDISRHNVDWHPCHFAMKIAGSTLPGFTRELLNIKKQRDKANVASNFLHKSYGPKKEFRLRRRYFKQHPNLAYK